MAERERESSKREQLHSPLSLFNGVDRVVISNIGHETSNMLTMSVIMMKKAKNCFLWVIVKTSLGRTTMG